MSIITLPRPLSTAEAIVGSVVMPASIPPFCRAAMKVEPAPAVTVVYFSLSMPFFLARYCVR